MLTDGIATHYIAPGSYNIASTISVVGTKTLIPVGAVILNRANVNGAIIEVSSSGVTLNLGQSSPQVAGTLTIDGGAIGVP